MSNVTTIVLENQLNKLINLESKVDIDADMKMCMMIGLSTVYQLDLETIYEMYVSLKIDALHK